MLTGTSNENICVIERNPCTISGMKEETQHSLEYKKLCILIFPRKLVDHCKHGRYILTPSETESKHKTPNGYRTAKAQKQN
jgi:hypothetical protein